MNIHLTGFNAIRYAMEGASPNICKHADPVEVAREGLTIEEAIDIARIDPSLIFLEVDTDSIDHVTIMEKLELDRSGATAHA